MKIRMAEELDLIALTNLFLDYLTFYNQPLDHFRCQQFLSERLKLKDSMIFVSEEISSKTLMGFVQLYPTFSSLSQQKTWILNDLFVSPNWRKQKVGYQLVLKAIDFSKQSQAKGLTLQTSKKNQIAQNLYQSMGWSREDEFITFYLNH